MNRGLTILFVLLLVAFFSNTAQADGNTFLQQCSPLMNFMDGGRTPTAAKDSYNVGFCLGFAQGISQTFAMLHTVGITTGICLSATGIQNGQALRIIVKYMRDNPEQLHLSQVETASVALAKAFPCKPEEPK